MALPCNIGYETTMCHVGNDIGIGAQEGFVNLDA